MSNLPEPLATAGRYLTDSGYRWTNEHGIMTMSDMSEGSITGEWNFWTINGLAGQDACFTPDGGGMVYVDNTRTFMWHFQFSGSVLKLLNVYAPNGFIERPTVAMDGTLLFSNYEPPAPNSNSNGFVIYAMNINDTDDNRLGSLRPILWNCHDQCICKYGDYMVCSGAWDNSDGNGPRIQVLGYQPWTLGNWGGPGSYRVLTFPQVGTNNLDADKPCIHSDGNKVIYRSGKIVNTLDQTPSTWIYTDIGWGHWSYGAAPYPYAGYPGYAGWECSLTDRGQLHVGWPAGPNNGVSNPTWCQNIDGNNEGNYCFSTDFYSIDANVGGVWTGSLNGAYSQGTYLYPMDPSFMTSHGVHRVRI